MYNVLGFACLFLELMVLICLKRNILGILDSFILIGIFCIVSTIMFKLGGKF